MSILLLMSLLGLTLLIPTLTDGESNAQEDTVDPEDTVDAEDTVDPEDPIYAEDTVDPEDTADAEEDALLLPATATLNETTNVVTVTTDPEETGTLHIVANRVDFINGSGSNFVHETSVFLVPDGVDLADEVETVLESGDSAFYYSVLSDIGATELGYWAYDPSAADGSTDAIPDFEYPAGIDTEFLQIYSTNFGDGGQINVVVDVASEEALTDGIEDYISSTTIALLESNGGAIVTLPNNFEGELVVLETTTDYFFEGQLVRTDVTVGFATLDEATDFATSALTLADQATETATSEGADYAITDGSLTVNEFVNQVPGTATLGSFGVSTIEYDTDGNVASEQIAGGLGVTSNVDIVRFEVQAVGEATIGSSSLWYAPTHSGLVTSFGNAENIAPVNA